MNAGIRYYRLRRDSHAISLQELYREESAILDSQREKAEVTGINGKIYIGMTQLKARINRFEKLMKKAEAAMCKRAIAVLTWHEDRERLEAEILDIRASISRLEARHTEILCLINIETNLIQSDIEFMLAYDKAMQKERTLLTIFKNRLDKTLRIKPREGREFARRIIEEVRTGEIQEDLETEQTIQTKRKNKKEEIELPEALRFHLSSEQLNKIETTFDLNSIKPTDLDSNLKTEEIAEFDDLPIEMPRD